MSGDEPDPRIVEAIPAVLAWVDYNPVLLKAYGIATRTTRRLAWLADVTLTIERKSGFRGGCRNDEMFSMVKHFLRSAAAQTTETVYEAMGGHCDRFV